MSAQNIYDELIELLEKIEKSDQLNGRIQAIVIIKITEACHWLRDHVEGKY